MKFPRVFIASIPAAATYSFYCLRQHNYENISLSTKVHARQQNLQLQHIQVLFRHGARTPIKSSKEYDNFTNIEAVEWSRDIFMKPLPHARVDFVLKSLHNNDVLQPRSPSLLLQGGGRGGELTTTGQQEAYDFGKWLADQYIVKQGFIPPMYTENGPVYVRSTYVQRTVYTAVGVMAGLYGKQSILEPVVIRTDEKNDHLGPNWGACAHMNKRFLYHWSVVEDGQEKLNEKMGVKSGARLYNYIEIHDIITQRKHHGQFVPQYLLDQQSFIADEALALMMKILGNNVNELRNNVGSLVETLCCEINEAIAGTSKRKAIFYAAHDTTVLCLQKVLGIFDGKWPPYVANVIIEVYKDDDGDHFVRVLHNQQPVVLDEEGMDQYLPVEKFMKLAQEYRVVDEPRLWQRRCIIVIHFLRALSFKQCLIQP